MAPVDWSALSPSQYEQMVALLVSHLHPNAVRIDGRGGDGGRDLQLVSDDGLQAFELKSFKGRLDRAQRRQVERSLATAARLSPTRWTLIVPIDATPGELRWFEGLQDQVPFPIEHRGRTWLETNLASRPCITRYVLEDAANEIIRLAELLDQEQAALARGVPDALDRLTYLQEQVDALDPYYRFELTLADGIAGVRIIPRYRGAERDRPIKVQIQFVFPDDEEGRAAAEDLRLAIDYGLPLDVPPEHVATTSIDAPAGLGGEFEGVSVRATPVPPDAVEHAWSLACVGEDGTTLAELPLEARLSSQGERGAIWDAVDRSGSIQVRVTADRLEKAGGVTLRIEPVAAYYPHDMWPAIRFLDALARAPAIELRGAGGPVGTAPVPSHEPFVDPRMADVLEGLVLIQTAARSMRRVPWDHSIDDLNHIMAAKALLEGQAIGVRWDSLRLRIADDAPPALRAKLLDGDHRITVVTNDPLRVTVAGASYSLGRRGRFDYDGHIKEVPESWRVAGAVPPGADVEFVPGATSKATLRLVPDGAGGS